MFLVEVIQLIENVYTEFHLEHAANRANPRIAGWMTVFRRWANSPRCTTRSGRKCKGIYNPLFQQFMSDHLRREVEDVPYAVVTGDGERRRPEAHRCIGRRDAEPHQEKGYGPISRS